MDGAVKPEAKRNDQEAFERVVGPYLNGLYHSALIITLNREAAEDAVQEGLIRAYTSFRRFRGDNYSAWLYRIVINEAKRQRYKLWRRPVPRELFSELPSPEASPEQCVLDNEQNRQLWQAVCRLSRTHRTVLVLRCFLEMSEAETAAVLRVPLGTVKSRLFHARKILEQHLLKHDVLESTQTGPQKERRPSHA